VAADEEGTRERIFEAVEKRDLRQPCHCERSEAIHHRPRNAISSRVLMDCFVVPPRNDTDKVCVEANVAFFQQSLLYVTAEPPEDTPHIGRIINAADKFSCILTLGFPSYIYTAHERHQAIPRSNTRLHT